MLDDTPIVPGDQQQPFTQADSAREVLNDAEASLRSWKSSVEPIQTSAAQLGTNAMATTAIPSHALPQTETLTDAQRSEALERAQQEELQHEKTENAAIAS